MKDREGDGEARKGGGDFGGYRGKARRDSTSSEWGIAKRETETEIDKKEEVEAFVCPLGSGSALSSAREDCLCMYVCRRRTRPPTHFVYARVGGAWLGACFVTLLYVNVRSSETRKRKCDKRFWFPLGLLSLVSKMSSRPFCLGF